MSRVTITQECQDYYDFRPTQNSLIHIHMICATLPAVGSWRPMAHQVTSRASCLPRDHKFFFCRTSPDPLSHHYCLSTSSEQFRFLVLFHTKDMPDMIFVKTFTLADFGPIIFYPKVPNSRHIKFCDITA